MWVLFAVTLFNAANVRLASALASLVVSCETGCWRPNWEPTCESAGPVAPAPRDVLPVSCRKDSTNRWSSRRWVLTKGLNQSSVLMKVGA
jgi:hypothetical protein